MNESFSYNKYYLLKNNKPWFPVMGEMHYSRYHDNLWEESLRKIKAGGVNIVSTYVIWIHHEEEEGVFDFTGCRNVKKFVELCKKVGVYCFLRLGPWVHGEVRNGGFPDWLIQKENVPVRTNDTCYLSYVERYWKAVFEQVKGLMLKDNGPVIGIQIENEYGHVGGLNGEAGETHIRTLTNMAKTIGFETSLYTATGWGGACVGDLLPVMGGYCDAPWDRRILELEPNANFVFSRIRNDSQIACDYEVKNQVTFDESKFPYLTAELGGGLQVTSHRRPIATGKDIGAMSLAKLGSGVSMLGYYMYHGGSNPKGKFSTLQESLAAGDLNELPEINYDFNAPIRQYGTISDNYKEIKLLAYFLEEFGEDFTTLREDILVPNERPDDLSTLRISSRHDDKHGYIFYNNYQRRYAMKPHKDVIFTGPLKDSEIIFPKLNIESGDFGFLPYNMKLGEDTLVYATASPLCRIKTKKNDYYVFYSNRLPEFFWRSKESVHTITLTREEALNSWKITLDQDYLIVSDNYVWVEDEELKIIGRANQTIKCFPKLNYDFKELELLGKEGEFYLYQLQHNTAEASVSVTKSDTFEYEVKMQYDQRMNREKGQDILLSIDFISDSMDVYCGSDKINDYFYTGQKAVLSLGYFDFPDKLHLVLHPLSKEQKLYLESWPDRKEEPIAELRGILVTYEQCTTLKVKQ